MHSSICWTRSLCYCLHRQRNDAPLRIATPWRSCSFVSVHRLSNGSYHINRCTFVAFLRVFNVIDICNQSTVGEIYRNANLLALWLWPCLAADGPLSTALFLSFLFGKKSFYFYSRVLQYRAREGSYCRLRQACRTEASGLLSVIAARCPLPNGPIGVAMAWLSRQARSKLSWKRTMTKAVTEAMVHNDQ